MIAKITPFFVSSQSEQIRLKMEKKGLIVAVDGHSSTGKSTVSKILAARLGYTYIDTGAMDRDIEGYARRGDTKWDRGG